MSNTFVIDIGEKFTRIVDARMKGKMIELVALGFAETTPNYYLINNDKSIQSQASIILNLMHSLKIVKRDVNVILPDSYSYSQILEVPRLNEKELQSAIRYQADQFIPLPIEETTIDLEILKEDEKNKKNTLLIVASPKKISEQVERTIISAGLIPNILENELNASRRFLKETVFSAHQNGLLLINFGFSSSSIYLFDPGNNFLISRNVKIGLDLFHKAVKMNFNVDDNKAFQILNTIGFESNASINVKENLQSIIKELINEINKFIILSKDKYQFTIEKIYTFNHDSFILSLNKEITEQSGINTTSFNLSQNLQSNGLSQNFKGNLSSFISAIAGNF